MSKTVIYVYGTLRPGLPELTEIPGVLYDLGWFPGVNLVDPEKDQSTFFAERVEVDDADLYRVDNYEGYNEKNPASSLFKRVPFGDGFVYVYNDDLSSLNSTKRVSSGDWLKYKGQSVGMSAGLLNLKKIEGKVFQTTEEEAA